MINIVYIEKIALLRVLMSNKNEITEKQENNLRYKLEKKVNSILKRYKEK